jgi:tRNA (cytidine/uridine-2'-O-)-methyltransferase
MVGCVIVFVREFGAAPAGISTGWQSCGNAAGIMRVALFEPDIAQNTGTILRLAACWGVPVDIIEPCGFLFGDARMRRAGMDYLASVEVVRHHSWAAFAASRSAAPGRLVLLTTKAQTPFHTVPYARDDVLLVGRESAGVPDAVQAAADLRVRIPMRPGLRSLNVAVAAAVVLTEALRQTRAYPEETPS